MDREYARRSFVDKDLSILLTHHHSEKKEEKIVHNKKLECSMEYFIDDNLAVLLMILYLACLIFFTVTFAFALKFREINISIDF